MQPNLIGADALPHRARFAWLGGALAATLAVALAFAPAAVFTGSEVRTGDRPESQMTGGYRVKRCGERDRHRVDRAQRRALRDAARAERAAARAERDAARAARDAARDAQRAAREAGVTIFY